MHWGHVRTYKLVRDPPMDGNSFWLLPGSPAFQLVAHSEKLFIPQHLNLIFLLTSLAMAFSTDSGANILTL